MFCEAERGRSKWWGASNAAEARLCERDRALDHGCRRCPVDSRRPVVAFEYAFQTKGSATVSRTDRTAKSRRKSLRCGDAQDTRQEIIRRSVERRSPRGGD